MLSQLPAFSDCASPCVLCVLLAGQKKTVHGGRGHTKTALAVPTPKKTVCKLAEGGDIQRRHLLNPPEVSDLSVSNKGYFL